MEDLISKRELLERYSVANGALYRWKRMGLIPEDWFLRRATPTGQETFFHRAQICPKSSGNRSGRPQKTGSS